MSVMYSNTKVENQNNISRINGKKFSRENKKYTSTVIEGSFYQAKPITMRELVTRRINKTLCIFLLFTIGVTFISYYIAMNYEAKLNALDREIVRINYENQDLQVYLDKFKSFNNVDNKVGEFKLLQKAEKVIEVTAMNTADVAKPVHKMTQNNYNWALGY